MSVEKNTLWYGDNLEVMRNHIKDESVDLIYLDPPFNSNADYNILYKEKSGEESQAQVKAFTDTWHWDDVAIRNYKYLIENPQVPENVSHLMKALHLLLSRKTGKPNDMFAYLVMMSVRLLELHRVLKSTGSIYLHCDSTASHYLKIIMDTIFGSDNFRNEIVWCYSTSGRGKKEFSKKHDTILFYSKTGDYFWNEKEAKIPYSEKYIKTHFTDVDEQGNVCRKRLDAGKWRIYYPDDGMIPNDWWEMPYVNSMSKERIGYPTQKPLILLERIIKSSSKEGDIVLDPFCGCGTAVDAAQNLKRRWIGIDITYLSINIIKTRLEEKYPYINIDIQGEPKDFESAKYLADRDKDEFEKWVVTKLGGRIRRPDKGVDGVIYLSDKTTDDTLIAIIQVKGGAIIPGMIRDFKSAILTENAYAGIFVTLREPTLGMISEAKSLGFVEKTNDLESEYDTEERAFRFQIITLKELMEGKRPRLPYKNVTLER